MNTLPHNDEIIPLFTDEFPIRLSVSAITVIPVYVYIEELSEIMQEKPGGSCFAVIKMIDECDAAVPLT